MSTISESKLNLVEKPDQSLFPPNTSNLIFKLDNFVTNALQNTKNKPLTEEDLAKLMGFTDKEILMLKLYWDPCFNKSWLYLSDELILENLTNDNGKTAIANFYTRILIPNYEENSDYKQVTIDNKIIKSWLTTMLTTNSNYKPASNKKYYLVTGESYKCMLMASKAKKGKETRKYYIKVEGLANTMTKYIFAYMQTQQEIKYKKLEKNKNSMMIKHRYYKIGSEGKGGYLINSGYEKHFKEGTQEIYKLGIFGYAKQQGCENCTCEECTDADKKKDTFDQRMQKHRTTIPLAEVKFIYYSKYADVVEKCLKIAFREELNPNGHEITESVTLEKHIEKVKEIFRVLNVSEEQYVIEKQENIDKYNEYIKTTIKNIEMEKKIEELTEIIEEQDEVIEEQKEEIAENIEIIEELNERLEEYKGYMEELKDYTKITVPKINVILDKCNLAKSGLKYDRAKKFLKEQIQSEDSGDSEEVIEYEEDEDKRELRECTKCEEKKELNSDNFTKFGYGYKKTCIECDLESCEMVKELREDKRTEIKEGDKTCKCPSCKEILSIEDFYKNKSNKNGHDSWCKNCTIKSKNKSRNNGELKEIKKIHERQDNVGENEKYCIMCKEVKEKSEYRSQKDGLQTYCKPCDNEKSRKNRMKRKILAKK
jgi:hypothetical protein